MATSFTAYQQSSAIIAINKRLRVVEIAAAAHRLLSARPSADEPAEWTPAHQRWFEVVTADPGLSELDGHIGHTTIAVLQAGIDQVHTEKELREAGRVLPHRDVALMMDLSKVVESAKRDVYVTVNRM